LAFFAFIGIVAISHWPILAGRLLAKEKAVSDLFPYLLLPLLQYSLMVISPIVAAKIGPKVSAFRIVWTGKWRFDFLGMIILSLLVLFVRWLVISIARAFEIPFAQNIEFHSKLGTEVNFLVLVTLLVSLVAPVAEEFFWRGFAQTRLSKNFGPFWGFLTQALFYAALHLRTSAGFFSVFAYGLVFGWWKHKRNTLLPIIIAHIVLNSTSFVGRWYYWKDLTKVKIEANYVAQFNVISQPPDFDPDSNAAVYYEKAYMKAVVLPQQVKVADLSVWPADLPQRKVLMMTEWLSANHEALNDVMKGSRQPYYWSEYAGLSMAKISPFDDMIKVRDLAIAVHYRAKINAMNGYLDKAFSDISCCYRISAQLSGPKTSIEQIT